MKRYADLRGSLKKLNAEKIIQHIMSTKGDSQKMRKTE